MSRCKAHERHQNTHKPQYFKKASSKNRERHRREKQKRKNQKVRKLRLQNANGETTVTKFLTEKDIHEMMQLQELIEFEEHKELEKIASLSHRQRPKQAYPLYQVFIKKSIAWILVFNAKMEIAEFEDRLIPLITLRHADFDALHRFSQIVKLGEVGNPRRTGTPPFTITKAWTLTNLFDIAYLLEKIEPYIRTRKARRKAQLLMTFCKSRAKHLEEDFTPQEQRITEEIKRLNLRTSRNVTYPNETNVEVW